MTSIRLILTTYEPRRRWYGLQASRFTLERRYPHKPGITIREPILEGWIPPTSYHEFELVDVTPQR